MTDIISLVGARKVRVSKVGVALFNARWSCSELQSSRAYWFEFGENGDLIDCDVPEHSDGLAAVALSHDCQAWLEDGTTPEWIP